MLMFLECRTLTVLLGCLRGKVMLSEITWGDTVIVAAIAPLEFRPGERGSVVSFLMLKTSALGY